MITDTDDTGQARDGQEDYTQEWQDSPDLTDEEFAVFLERAKADPDSILD